MLGLPKTATAPFCPSEVQGSVVMPRGLPTVAAFLKYAGPGLLISVGYMDPGNWATDIEAGSRYGYGLLFAVALASLAGIVQILSARLGIVTGRDLAQLCRDRYPLWIARALWVFAEISIVACDVAEVLGGALALQLLFHLPLWMGILLTALDTVLVLGLKGKGFRSLEAIVAGLVGTIAAAFALELFFVPPDVAAVARGLFPSARLLADPHAVYLAVGILGATVMPHNLYLHSSVVQTRAFEGADGGKARGVAFATADIALSLVFALLINGAILVVAGSAFHGRADDTADISQAYKLLQPIAGPAAALIFGVALLASGQSSTFTGTIAGQLILEGFLDLRIPCWQQRLLTRALAIVPALVGVLWLGDGAIGKLLVLSQVVLSLQLPFALYPLIRFTNSREIMGGFASGLPTKAAAWALFAVITAANLWLLLKLVQGGG
jgi:manganese transport protein